MGIIEFAMFFILRHNTVFVEKTGGLAIDVVISPVAIAEKIPHHHHADGCCKCYVVADELMALGGSWYGRKELVESGFAKF